MNLLKFSFSEKDTKIWPNRPQGHNQILIWKLTSLRMLNSLTVWLPIFWLCSMSLVKNFYLTHNFSSNQQSKLISIICPKNVNFFSSPLQRIWLPWPHWIETEISNNWLYLTLKLFYHKNSKNTIPCLKSRFFHNDCTISSRTF